MSVKDAETSASNQRTVIPNGRCKSQPRRKVVAIIRNYPCIRPDWIRDIQLPKALAVTTAAENKCQMIADAQRVLREEGNVIGVRMRSGAAKVLRIKTRHGVSEGAQRSD